MNPVFNETVQGYLRTRYSAQDVFIADPCTPVFRAKVATAITSDSTYLEIEYDTVSLGAYTAIKTGMQVVISETTDHTQPVIGYREMRVADVPTVSILPVNESALPLLTTYYITVLDTYKPLQRARSGSLVDGRFAFQGQTGAIRGLPSAQLVVSTTTGTFNLAEAIDTFDGSTVTGIVYDIPGATYVTGNSTTLDSSVSLPTETHVWGRLTFTLSTGVVAYMVFQLIVILPQNSSLVIYAVDGLRINRTWSGHRASVRAYRDVTTSEVMNGTRCVVASIARLAGGAVGLEAVKFVGYLTRESNGFEVTQDGIQRYVQFDLSSIWERAAQLPMSPIAIRDAATPSRWDEINLPTPQKIVNYILTRYSTVLTLCSLNVDTTDNTWYGGETNVPSTSPGDALNNALEEIVAHLTPTPSGELYLRRDLRDEDSDTRDDADIVWTLEQSDVSGGQYNERHDELVGRLLIGFRGFFTNRSPSKGGKALAPAQILGTSPETKTYPNQLMRANLSDTALVEAAAQRAGNLFEIANPRYEFSGTGRPSLSYLNPNCFQWINVDLPVSTLTRGRAITGRHLLVSVEIEYDNVTGIHRVQFELVPETTGVSALIIADLTPNVTQITSVVTPPQFAYGGNYGGPSTLNVPDEDTRPTFNRGEMGGMGNPLPADQNYEEGLLSPDPGCMSYAISFSNPTAVGAGFVSVLGEDYTVTASGNVRVGNARIYDFLSSAQGWGDPDYGSTYTPSNGWHYNSFNNFSIRLLSAPFDVYRIEVTLTNFDASNFYPTASNTYADEGRGVFSSGTTRVINLTGGDIFAQGSRIGITGDGPYASSQYIRQIKLSSITGGVTYRDSFYEYELDDNGNPVNWVLLGATAGLFFNGATAATTPPPFNENHSYTFTWVGDGNEIDAHFETTDYTGLANMPLHLTICGPGAAT